MFSKLCELLISGTANQGDQDGDDGFDPGNDIGYSAAFAQLHHAQKMEIDPLPEIGSVKEYLLRSLGNLAQTRPEVLPILNKYQFN